MRHTFENFIDQLRKEHFKKAHKIASARKLRSKKVKVYRNLVGTLIARGDRKFDRYLVRYFDVCSELVSRNEAIIIVRLIF